MSHLSKLNKYIAAVFPESVTHPGAPQLWSLEILHCVGVTPAIADRTQIECPCPIGIVFAVPDGIIADWAPERPRPPFPTSVPRVGYTELSEAPSS